MVLAITFYLGIKLEDEEVESRDGAYFARFEFNLNEVMDQDQTNELIEAMLDCREESEQICWWINRAISHIKPYVGECTRAIQINSQ